MTLSEFHKAAVAEAEKNGIENTESVAVYAFIEFGKSYYVCQMAFGEQVMRAPIMHSPDAAVTAFGESIRQYQENGNKTENTDIEL